MSIHSDFILELERLSNECKRQADYIVDRSVKQSDQKEEIVAALVALLKSYFLEAQELSNWKNAQLGFSSQAQIDTNMVINGESVTKRIRKYVTDLIENIETFKENDNPLLVGLGINLLSLPIFRAIEIDRHRKLVKEGKRGAASSAAFLSNLDRNIFGGIFYAGRLSDAQNWALMSSLRAVEVITRRDDKVCEQCKAMEGIYPPDYIFTGNHPRCRCQAVPITIGPTMTSMNGRILEYALKNKHKFGKLMIYKLNAKYYDI